MEYRVYIKVNADGYITTVDSSAFLTDTEGWIEIDSGEGIKYSLAQGNYFPKPIYVSHKIYRYKLVDGVPTECTPDEIAVQEEARKPKTVAPRNVIVGEYITVNGILYKAILNIPNGEPIVAGKNAIQSTIEEQLAELMKGE